MRSVEKRFAKVDKAYEFLVEKERLKQTFTAKEIAKEVGWNPSSVRTYLAKRWVQYVSRVKDAGYSVVGVKVLGRDGFRQLNSQTSRVHDDQLDMLLKKSREFALLAVSVYNNPYSAFKSYGYIVNIIIALTSLFHAVFRKRGADYYHRDGGGKVIIIDGEEKAFELSKCLEAHWSGMQNPIKANLEFLIGLRNKIEHRSLPAIDLAVAGECQAALTNFENIITTEFGDDKSLSASLAISLQLSRAAHQAQAQALKELQTKNYDVIRKYIDSYRNDLEDEIKESQEFRVSVFLIPKLKNHVTSADLCVEFVNVNTLDEDQIQEYERLVAFVKGTDSPYRYRPGNVVSEIKKMILGFNTSVHTKAWKYYSARPKNEDKSFRGKYAGWVAGHDNYLYSKAWIDFLTEKLVDPGELGRVKSFTA